jgi:hypothetical protein
MRAGLLTVTVHLPGVHSLKEKRSLLKPLIHRIDRLGPAVAIAEIDDQDCLTRATLRIVHISNDPRRTESVLDRILAMLDGCRDLLVEESVVERI